MNTSQHPSNSSSGGGSRREISFLEFYSLVAGGKTIILALVLLGMVAAAVYTMMVKPTYEATSLLLVDTKARSGALPFPEAPFENATSKITNELEALRSVSVAGAAADALIARRYLDSAKTVILPLLAAVQAGSPGQPQERQRLIDGLRRSLDFAPVKESDIIRVTARSHDPSEAALLANTYVSAYMERNLSFARTRTKAAREFLEAQLAEKHQALEGVENKLQAYMQTSGIVALDQDTRKVVEQLSQLEATRDAVDVEIGSRSKTLQSYREELSKLGPDVARSLGESGDAYIRLLQEQLAKLEVQRDLTVAQNPDLASEPASSEQFRQIDEQINKLKKNLRERTSRFIESSVPSSIRSGTQEGFTGFLGELKQKVIEQQVEVNGLTARRQAVNRVIKDYEQQFNRIPRKAIEYARLQRDRLSNEKLYLMVEEKFNELAISESSHMGSVVVMDEAVVPLKPVRPVLLFNLVLGALAGLAGGVLFVVLRALFELRIFRAEDLRKRGYAILTTIGKMDAGSLGKARPPQGGRRLDPHLVVYMAPLHPAAESFRHLYTGLQHQQQAASGFSLVVTSPNPGEGKSTAAANLALAAAEGGRKVLLVDADMRRPVLHVLFGLENRAGFSDCLQECTPYRDLVRRNVVAHLDLITCGAPAGNPAAALASDRLEELIREVQEAYDLVVFDAPPLHAVSDASALSRKTGGAVVIVSAGQTTVPSLQGGVESLLRVGSNVLGVVLNNYDARRSLQHGYSEAGYGYYAYGYAYHSNNGKKKAKVILD